MAELNVNKQPSLVFVQHDVGDEFSVYQDGKEIHGIRSIRIDAGAEEFTTHEIEYLTGATIPKEDELKTTFTEEHVKAFKYAMTNPTPTKKPATNERRKEAIEKAKKFVAEVTRKAKRNYSHTDGNYTYINKLTRPEIIVNEEKRTVVVLAKGINSGILWEKGIAKCDPSDVFNADIGKAIALGRAYGLDVSEFEQAPQPDEVVVGHGFQSEMGTVGRVTELIDRKVLGGLYGKAFLHSEGNGWLGAKQVRILADSEAQY